MKLWSVGFDEGAETSNRIIESTVNGKQLFGPLRRRVIVIERRLKRTRTKSTAHRWSRFDFDHDPDFVLFSKRNIIQDFYFKKISHSDAEGEPRVRPSGPSAGTVVGLTGRDGAETQVHVGSWLRPPTARDGTCIFGVQFVNVVRTLKLLQRWHVQADGVGRGLFCVWFALS